MKKYDIIALGELNVDLLFNEMKGTPALGKEIFAGKMHLVMGSSTAIFAANAAALGSYVAFLGMIGEDSYGEVVRKELSLKGVDIEHLIVRPELQTGITVSMNYGNDRISVTYPGAMSVMGLGDIDAGLISKARHVHISSLFLQKNLKKDIQAVVKMIKESGATVSLDTQWDPLERWEFDAEAVLPYIDVFMPNKEELLCISRKNNIEEALDSISSFANIIVVKMGTQGSLLLKKDGSRKLMPAFLNEKVVDTVGAGDSFDAGFISFFVKGYDLEECQRIGNLTGAINTTSAGGTSAFSSPARIKEAAAGLFGQNIDI